MKVIRTVIVEDEKRAAEGLRAQLARVAPEVAVLAIAHSVQDARSQIAKHSPDLVFLDIELRDGSGFELLQGNEQLDFGVVFTTAYDNYAVRAFRFSAVDYLLKPINAEDLRAAVARFAQRELPGGGESVQTLVQNENRPERERKLAIHESAGIRFLQVRQILRLEAESNYCRIFLDKGQSILSTRGLKNYAELLEPIGFFRCHRSFLVNLALVRRYTWGRKPQLEMEDGSVIPIARDLREALLQRLEDFSL